jgi:MFS family permease
MTSTVVPYASLAEPDRAIAAKGRYRLLTMLCIAACIAYVQRQGVGGVSATAIRKTFSLDTFWMGTVMSGWLLGYSLAQVPSGWLADRWGSRVALTVYALLWSALTGLTALAQEYFSVLVLWTLMGIAQAGIFPSSTKAIRDWFSIERRASANGLLASSMAIGGALAPWVTAELLEQGMTWRQILWLYMVPGILWAMIYYWTISDASRDSRAPTSSDDEADDVWRRIVGSGSMWLLCAQQFLRAAAMIFFATWFPTFLQESRGVTVARSGWLTAIAGIGAVVGATLGGFASDKVLTLTGSRRLSRQGIAVVGMVSCAALIFTAHFVRDPTLAVIVISIGTFCACFGGVSGYTVALDLGGRRVATVFSVMNMCGGFGAVLFPVAIGWLVRYTGNWDLVLFIFAGMFALDAVFWYLLNPKGPLFPEKASGA